MLIKYLSFVWEGTEITELWDHQAMLKFIFAEIFWIIIGKYLNLSSSFFWIPITIRMLLLPENQLLSYLSYFLSLSIRIQIKVTSKKYWRQPKTKQQDQILYPTPAFFRPTLFMFYHQNSIIPTTLKSLFRANYPANCVLFRRKQEYFSVGDFVVTDN